MHLIHVHANVYNTVDGYNSDAYFKNDVRPYDVVSVRDTMLLG